MSIGLTEREQRQYRAALDEWEFNDLLINALRKSQGTFQEGHADRFEQFHNALLKMQDHFAREIREFERKIAAATPVAEPQQKEENN